MANRIAQFVVKISKFCNLRCRYCYEMEELGSKVSMTREHLRRIYQHVESYYGPRDAADEQQTEVRFIWHGGEPLLIEPQRFWDTFADQRDVFGDRIKVMNLVQTNLTVLDADRIRLLRDGFNSVGVSVDLFGGLRVNLAGRDSGRVTLRNMDVLRKEKIRFGCITVLTRKNIRQIAQICRFYEQAGLHFRLLPLFDGAYEGQLDDFNVTSREILEAFKTVFDLWLESERGFHAIPISQHIESVVHHLAGGPRRYYNKAAWNSALLINTNGDCYSSGDPAVNQNLALEAAHWPRFAPVALEAGFRSVHALPMRLRGLTIGALNLFRADEGLLDDADVAAAQALADVATIALLQHRAALEAHIVIEQLNNALNSRVLIEQAKGVLAERAQLSMDGAFSWLRDHARSHNLFLVDVAEGVISGTVQPDLS